MSQSVGHAEGGYGTGCDESASFCEPSNKPDAAADEFSAAIEDIVTRVRLAHGTEASGDLISSAVQICSGPGVGVDGLLPLPVNAHVFASLQPLGGNESAIDPPRLAFDNAAWQGGGVPAHFLDAVTRDFGIPAGSVCASLRGLLVTGPGGDLAHRICEPKTPGQIGALVIVLPSKWEGGILTARHGPVSQEFGCEGSLHYGGHLQFIAYFAGCKLSATPITAGYRTALVYGLSMQPAICTSAPFSVPMWPSHVSRLQALLRTWCAQLTAGDAAGACTPRRVLLLLDSARGDGDPASGGLTGRDASVSKVLRYALQGCSQLGGYLARVKISQSRSADGVEREVEELERDANRFIDYTRWELRDKVDLRSGKGLALCKETLSSQGQRPQDTVLVPSLVSSWANEDGVVDHTFDGDRRDSATRVFRRAVVLCLRHDPWQEFAAAVSVDAAFDRLLKETATAGADAGAGAFFGGESFLSLTTSSWAGDTLPRLSSPVTTLPETSQLREDLLSRGPLDIATSLFDFLVGQGRSNGPPLDPPCLPRALLKVVAAAERRSVLDARATLLCRVFRDFTLDAFAKNQSDLVAVMAAVECDERVLLALRDGLQRHRSSISLFSGALQLSRELIELGAPAPAAHSSTPYAGHKRRRDDNSDAVVVAVARAIDSEGHAMATNVALLEAGRSVLGAVAHSFADASDVSSDKLLELVTLVLAYGRLGDIESFVCAKLHVIVGHHESLIALFEPRGIDVASAVERAILQCVPLFSVRPHCCAMLLALAQHICRMSAHPTHQPDVTDSLSALDSHGGTTPISRCAAVAQLLPPEPRETSILSLLELPAMRYALGYRVVDSPVVIADGLARRILQAIIEAWPTTPVRRSQGPVPTGVLLWLLLGRPGCSLAPAFVVARLGQIVASASDSRVLIRALFSADTTQASRVALWDAVAAGFETALNPKQRNWETLSCVLAISEAIPTGASALVASLYSELRRSATGGAASRNQWDPRPSFMRVLHALITSWPDVAAVVATRDVLRTLVRIGDAGATVEFLARVPSRLLLSSLLDETRSGKRNAPFSFLTSAIERLGWSPFGASLGIAVANALRSEPSVPRTRLLDLPAAVHISYAFHDACMSLEAARDGSGEATAEARDVVQPVQREMLDIATGATEAHVAPLSDTGIATVAEFLLSMRRQESTRSAGVVAAWLRFIGSTAGAGVYPMASVVGFARGVLNGTLRSSVPHSIICLLLDAVRAAERRRLAEPVPPVSWERPAVCLECRQNPDGPSSCYRISAFLHDPVEQIGSFSFTNRQKQKHVVGLFTRRLWLSTCTVSENDRQVQLTKRPDAQAESVREAALAQRSTDCALLQELEELVDMYRASRAASFSATVAAQSAAAATTAAEQAAQAPATATPPGTAAPAGAGPRVSSIIRDPARISSVLAASSREEGAPLRNSLQQLLPPQKPPAPSFCAVQPRPPADLLPAALISPPLIRSGAAPGSAGATTSPPNKSLPQAVPSVSAALATPAAPRAVSLQEPFSAPVVIDLVASDEEV